MKTLALVVAGLTAAFAPGQSVDAQRSAPAPRLLLAYATFDPLVDLPVVPAELLAGADTRLHIAQFDRPISDTDRAAMRAAGARLHSPLPHCAIVVRAAPTTRANLARLPDVRWVGVYHPAYRLDGRLLTELAAAAPLPAHDYNLVLADKRSDKRPLTRKIAALGGTITNRHGGGILLTATLSREQLVQVARCDEVLWIDRPGATGILMDNARVQGGVDHVAAVAGYTGSGIRGHVFEGVEANHSDFNTAFTNILSSGAPNAHGHCTAGIVFGNGTSTPAARGIAPDATGFYTDNLSMTNGASIWDVITAAASTHECMFTTRSWAVFGPNTYGSVAAEWDDILFETRIPATQALGNTGSSNFTAGAAWAKNVFAIGGFFHWDNASPTDDTWANGWGLAPSRGPAADGRTKPDLAAYYESIHASDLSGAAGYSAGNSYASFGGTSGATPIVAGMNALAIQMFTDHVFGNSPRAPNGDRFANRPYAQTLKAMMIATANAYTPTATDLRREHVGWGMPNVGNLWDRRHRIVVVPEDRPITQGAIHAYDVQVVPGETRLKICLTWLEPPANPAAAIARLNDLDVRARHPDGTTFFWGNRGLVGPAQGAWSTSGGSRDAIDTVECIFVNNPAPGTWTIEVTAPIVSIDAHSATPATDATYALVINGGYRGCARPIDTADAGRGTPASVPLGSRPTTALATQFLANDSSAIGGAVYFDLESLTELTLAGVDLNTDAPSGAAITIDVYTTAASHVGRETNPIHWTARTAGHGTAAGIDNPSAVFFNEPLALPSTTTGVAIVARDFRHRHTVGTAGYQTFADSRLRCITGAATNAAFTGPVTAPRVANLNLHYRAPVTLDDSRTRVQFMLRREQLGPAGAITDVAFAPASAGRHFFERLEVRMEHKPRGYLPSTSFATNLTMPFTTLARSDHSWQVVADTWQPIGLDFPFAYDGSSDVLVEILAIGKSGTPWSTNSGFRSGGQPMIRASNWIGASPATNGVNDPNGPSIRVEMTCASTASFGTACGPLRAAADGSPTRGATFAFELRNAITNATATLVLGFDDSRAVSLTPLGLTNCFAWNDPIAVAPESTNAAGAARHAIAIPNSSVFDGTKVLGHWYQLDASQAGGATVSNATRMVIGSAP